MHLIVDIKLFFLSESLGIYIDDINTFCKISKNIVSVMLWVIACTFLVLKASLFQRKLNSKLHLNYFLRYSLGKILKYALNAVVNLL